MTNTSHAFYTDIVSESDVEYIASLAIMSCHVFDSEESLTLTVT